MKTKLLKVGTLKSKKEGRPLVLNGSISIYKMKTQEKKQKVLLQESYYAIYVSLMGFIVAFRF